MNDAMYDGGIVNLARAVLCADCETISEAMRQCPACGAETLLNLARILNRDEEAA